MPYKLHDSAIVFSRDGNLIFPSWRAFPSHAVMNKWCNVSRGGRVTRASGQRELPPTAITAASGPLVAMFIFTSNYTLLYEFRQCHTGSVRVRWVHEGIYIVVKYFIGPPLNTGKIIIYIIISFLLFAVTADNLLKSNVCLLEFQRLSRTPVQCSCST